MADHKRLKSEDVPLRSEVVQEIMGKVPHVLIRWGNTLILIITVGMLIVSYFLRYPNTIKTQVELTTTNPSSEVYAMTNGKLIGIVESGAIVQYHAVLALLETSKGTQELRSPTNGTVYGVSFSTEGSAVNEGELLFKIVPAYSGSYQGIIRLPYQDLGKINLGQKVRIRLSNSATEQNVIEGSVLQISPAANEKGQVAIQILLDKGLTTSSGKKISYTPGMLGSAEVVIENPRLIEHFFHQLRSIF